MEQYDENNLINRFGFWASIIATICSLMFLIALIIVATHIPLNLNWHGIQQYRLYYNSIQIFIFTVPCCLLAPSVLTLIASLYYKTKHKNHFLCFLALVFTIIYVGQITMNYYIQMSAVHSTMQSGDINGFTAFAFGNPNSIFWSIEILGYTFLSIAMLILAPIFNGSKIKITIKWIFIINGFLGIIAPLQDILKISSPPIGLMLFGITFPISTALIAYLFKKDINFE